MKTLFNYSICSYCDPSCGGCTGPSKYDCVYCNNHTF